LRTKLQQCERDKALPARSHLLVFLTRRSVPEQERENTEQAEITEPTEKTKRSFRLFRYFRLFRILFSISLVAALPHCAASRPCGAGALSATIPCPLSTVHHLAGEKLVAARKAVEN
jgi:hypothetical protein